MLAERVVIALSHENNSLDWQTYLTSDVERKGIFPPLATPWHAKMPTGFRRRKTPSELQAGCEFFELYDRQFPGRLARGKRID